MEAIKIMKSATKTRHSIGSSLYSVNSAQADGNFQVRTSKDSGESWQHELAKARKKFKRLSNGRCLSQELIDERAHER